MMKTRPSHYEALGLEPTASEEEIARAFARQISTFQPRAFGGIAAVSVAYEVLRDPVRRRAYDESIGIKREPERRPPPPTKLAFHFRQEWKSGAFPIAPPGQPEAGEAAEPEVVESEPELLEAEAEPEVVEAAPEADTIEYRPLPRTQAEPSLEQQFEQLRADHSTGGFSIDWKRPAVIVGTLFLGAAAIGAFAGWKSVEAIEPEQAKAATVGRPAGQAKLVVVPGAAAAEQRPVVAAERPVASPQVRPRIPQSTASETSALEVPADSIAEEIQVVDSASAAATPVEGPAAAQVADAAMPLPNRTIARTIARIGYACGEVASTSPAGGAGVFKVTCTSGDSYRAAPVRGRYHFRKWAG